MTLVRSQTSSPTGRRLTAGFGLASVIFAAGCELIWFGGKDPCEPFVEAGYPYDHTPQSSPTAAQLEATLDVVEALRNPVLITPDGASVPVTVNFEPDADDPLRLLVSDGRGPRCDDDYGSWLEGSVTLSFGGEPAVALVGHGQLNPILSSGHLVADGSFSAVETPDGAPLQWTQAMADAAPQLGIGVGQPLRLRVYSDPRAMSDFPTQFVWGELRSDDDDACDTEGSGCVPETLVVLTSLP